MAVFPLNDIFLGHPVDSYSSVICKYRGASHKILNKCFIIFSSGVKVVRRTTSARLSEAVRSLAWMLVFCPHNWITRSWYCFSGINQPSSLVDTHTLYTIQMEKREAECQLLMFVEIEASIAVVFLQYISSKMNQKNVSQSLKTSRY